MQLMARVVSIVFLVSVGVVPLSSGISTSAAYAAVLDPSTVKSATLHNGLVVIVCEDTTAAVVSIEVVARVGSADEPAEIGGVAHLLEHLCWVGAGASDPRAAIEEVGGVTNAGTLRDYTRFYATVPASDFRLALRSLAEMVVNGSFQQEVVDRERAVILEEVAVRRDQPRVLMNDLTFQELFGDNHPYGRPIEGSERSLRQIDESKLIAFHHNWYVPNNMAVVIAGKVDFETVLTSGQRWHSRQRRKSGQYQLCITRPMSPRLSWGQWRPSGRKYVPATCWLFSWRKAALAACLPNCWKGDGW